MSNVEVPAQREASCGTLSTNARKARYGVAYLRTLCHQAGVQISETSPDEDSQAIDCTIVLRRGVVLAQVKCTGQFKIKGASASWPMELHWNESWASFQLPVYFVMVIVEGDDPHNWLKHPTNGTFHHAAAFWTRVDIDTPVDSVRIDKAQRLTVETFQRWAEDLSACFVPRTVPDAS